jgi:hypothetical protein
MPQQIRRVTVLRELGAGNQGSVSLAREPDGRFVAFKRPRDAANIARLAREAERAGQLVHPNSRASTGWGRTMLLQTTHMESCRNTSTGRTWSRT